MNEQTKKYREGELKELKTGDDWYTIRLLDSQGGKTKYMNITPEELAAISAILLGGLRVKIEVIGGVAEVTDCPDCVFVTLLDHD